MDNQHDAFLSHSGLDHELASSLSSRIEQALNIRVFNTSESEYRFKELFSVIRPGMNLAIEVERYEAELRDYIRGNLLSSKAYLLLVTRRSLEAESSWVEFEMELANDVARERGLFFFPCVAEGAHLGMLPGVARWFQGIELEEEHGFTKLLSAMRQALEKA